MADQVLYSGVACITDLMVKEGLINLDFADVRSVMREMGKAMMGTGEASGDGRAMAAAEAAIANPLLDETSMRGAKGLLISITGGRDLTLFEVDEAATRIREEVDQDANIILGATFDEELDGVIRVSVVATGIDKTAAEIAAAPLAIRQPRAQAGATQTPARPLPRSRSPQDAAARRNAYRPIRSPKRSGMAEINAAEFGAARPVQAADDEFRPQSKLFQAPPAQPLQQPAAAPMAPAGRAERAAGAAAAHAAGRGFPAARQGGESRPRPDARRTRRTAARMGLLKRLDQRPVAPRGRARPSCSRAQPREPSCASRPGGPPRLRAAGPAALRAAARPARRARPRRCRSSAPCRKTTSWRFRPSCAARRTERLERLLVTVTGSREERLPVFVKHYKFQKVGNREKAVARLHGVRNRDLESGRRASIFRHILAGGCWIQGDCFRRRQLTAAIREW